jgi:hypothetical protein
VPSGFNSTRPIENSLQDLARVILIGDRAVLRVGLVAVRHVEVVTHRRAQGHVLQQGSIVAECIVEQDVLVVGESVGFIDLDARNHHDLRERERDALAQLIRVIERVGEEIALHLKWRVLCACAKARCIGRIRTIADATGRRGMGCVAVSGVLGRRICDLLGDVGIDADTLHVRDIARRDAERCLIEQPRRIRGGDRWRGRRRRWGRR